MNAGLLDSIPLLVVTLGFAVISFAFYEIGFRVGLWWQARMPGEQEGPTDVLVGSLLALMAFLLAVTMSMAADRFDTRRGLVVAEANAIGTTYLQADYLPQPATDEMRALLREYLPLRIAGGRPRAGQGEHRTLEGAARRDVADRGGGGPQRAQP